MISKICSFGKLQNHEDLKNISEMTSVKVLGMVRNFIGDGLLTATIKIFPVIRLTENLRSFHGPLKL